MPFRDPLVGGSIELAAEEEEPPEGREAVLEGDGRGFVGLAVFEEDELAGPRLEIAVQRRDDAAADVSAPPPWTERI